MTTYIPRKSAITITLAALVAHLGALPGCSNDPEPNPEPRDKDQCAVALCADAVAVEFDERLTTGTYEAVVTADGTSAACTLTVTGDDAGAVESDADCSGELGLNLSHGGFTVHEAPNQIEITLTREDGCEYNESFQLTYERDGDSCGGGCLYEEEYIAFDECTPEVGGVGGVGGTGGAGGAGGTSGGD